MKKQEYKTVLENEYVNRVKKGGGMTEIIEGFNMSVLQGDENIGNISYNKGGYIYCQLKTSLPPEKVKEIINEIVADIKVEVAEKEPIENVETEQQ